MKDLRATRKAAKAEAKAEAKTGGTARVGAVDGGTGFEPEGSD